MSKALSEAPVPALRDRLDRDLITLLQANARESTANLARKLGIARTTVVARLARLEADGLIAGYTVRLGGEAVDQIHLLLNRIVLESGMEVESVAPADDDVNSVYQYLIGGEGSTI